MYHVGVDPQGFDALDRVTPVTGKNDLVAPDPETKWVMDLKDHFNQNKGQ